MNNRRADLDRIKPLNGISVSKYKNHPRILELRFVMVYTALCKYYSVNLTQNLMQDLCQTFKCNWQLLSGVINNIYKIRRLEKLDKLRYRQEVLFMGYLYGESRHYVTNAYLDVSTRTIYKKGIAYLFEEYLDQAWLDKLDDHVAICGIANYKLEVARFIEALEYFMEAMGRVSFSKTKL